MAPTPGLIPEYYTSVNVIAMSVDPPALTYAYPDADFNGFQPLHYIGQSVDYFLAILTIVGATFFKRAVMLMM